MTMSKSKIRWAAVGVVALALSAVVYSAAAYGGSPAQQEPVIGSEWPLPVEPDGGIGDTPIPVEPDGGIGDTPIPVEQVR